MISSPIHILVASLYTAIYSCMLRNKCSNLVLYKDKLLCLKWMTLCSFLKMVHVLVKVLLHM